MKVSRGVETSVEGGVEKMVVDRYRYRGSVEEQINKFKNKSSIDRSTRCREAIEEAGTFSINPPGVDKLSGLR